MVYLYDACDQISDFCHQQLLRKMLRKISWTDGRTDRGKTVYPPPPSGSGGINIFISNTQKERLIDLKIIKLLLIFFLNQGKFFDNKMMIKIKTQQKSLNIYNMAFSATQVCVDLRSKWYILWTKLVCVTIGPISIFSGLLSIKITNVVMAFSGK